MANKKPDLNLPLHKYIALGGTVEEWKANASKKTSEVGTARGKK